MAGSTSASSSRRATTRAATLPPSRPAPCREPADARRSPAAPEHRFRPPVRPGAAPCTMNRRPPYRPPAACCLRPDVAADPRRHTRHGRCPRDCGDVQSSLAGPRIPGPGGKQAPALLRVTAVAHEAVGATPEMPQVEIGGDVRERRADRHLRLLRCQALEFVPAGKRGNFFQGGAEGDVSRNSRKSRRMRCRRKISELCSGRVEPPGCTASVCGHLPASRPIICMKPARAGSTSFAALPILWRESAPRRPRARACRHSRRGRNRA
jgi:hypothetical protein